MASAAEVENMSAVGDDDNEAESHNVMDPNGVENTGDLGGNMEEFDEQEIKEEPPDDYEMEEDEFEEESMNEEPAHDINQDDVLAGRAEFLNEDEIKVERIDYDQGQNEQEEYDHLSMPGPSKRRRSSSASPERLEILVDPMQNMQEDTEENDEFFNSLLSQHPGKTTCCKLCKKKYSDRWALVNHLKTVHAGIKQYKCDYCDKQFSKEADRDRHMKWHTNYKCDVCEESFGWKKDLWNHKKMIHGQEKPHECSICGKTFADQKLLSNHKVRHTEEYQQKPHKCDMCGKGFPLNSHLMRHVRHVHLGEKKHECNLCGKKLSNVKALKTHLAWHQNYKCDLCGKHFGWKQDLLFHMKTVHSQANEGEDNDLADIKTEDIPEGNGNRCDLCDKEFSDKRSLMNHKLWHKNYKCDQCGMYFGWKQDLQFHERTVHQGVKEEDTRELAEKKELMFSVGNEDGDKKYQCKLCEKSYRDKRDILKHILWHKNHKCKTCGEHFGWKQDLEFHEKTVHANQQDLDDESTVFSEEQMDQEYQPVYIGEEKGYQCQLCSKVFKVKGNAMRHVLWHKNYKCDTCGERFGWKQDLMFHERTVHQSGHEVLDIKPEITEEDEFTQIEVNGEKTYQCHSCEKRIKDKAGIMRHVLWHKNYKCDKCGENFGWKQDLIYHDRTVHQNQNDFDPESSNASSDASDLQYTIIVEPGCSDKKYQCNLCERVLCDKRTVMKHLLWHKNYKCATCGETFGWKQDLIYHERKAHNLHKPPGAAEDQKPPAEPEEQEQMFYLVENGNVKRFQCKMCEKSFSKKGPIMRHVLWHKNHKCEKCGQFFAWKQDLLFHDRTVHQGEEHTDEDSKDAVKQEPEQEHEQDQQYTVIIDEGERKYQCGLCEKILRDKGPMMMHILWHKNHKCETCGEYFGWKQDLLYHEKTVHSSQAASGPPPPDPMEQFSLIKEEGGGKKFQCHLCERSFRDKRVILKHVLWHRNYKCETCGEFFGWKQDLMYHERTTHQLNENQDSSEMQEDLQYSLIDTGGEKTYQCHMCEKRIRDKAGIMRHVLWHKNYKCEKCGEHFGWKQDLLYHDKTVHEGNLNESASIHDQDSRGDFSDDSFQYAHSSFSTSVAGVSVDDGEEQKQPDPMDQFSLIHEDGGGKRYQCHLCERNFRDKRVIMKHVLWHRNHKCEQCGETFGWKQDLLYHEKTVHTNPVEQENGLEEAIDPKEQFSLVDEEGEKRYQCHLCEKSFRDKRVILKHVLWHRNYKCEHCGEHFGWKQDLLYHERTVHQNNESMDSKDLANHSQFPMLDNSSVENGEDLKQGVDPKEQFSLIEEDGEKRYQCHLCEKTFRDKRIILKHVLWHRNHKCTECSATFGWKQDLWEHLKNVHNEENPHECDLCGKKFAHTKSLSHHKLTIHFDVKQFKCDMCPRRFSEKKSLMGHLNWHLNYRCEMCPQTFGWKKDLWVHMKADHGVDEPHECETCGKRFASSKSLSHHRADHKKAGTAKVPPLRLKINIGPPPPHYKEQQQQEMEDEEADYQIEGEAEFEMEGEAEYAPAEEPNTSNNELQEDGEKGAYAMMLEPMVILEEGNREEEQEEDEEEQEEEEEQVQEETEEQEEQEEAEEVSDTESWFHGFEESEIQS